jgi:hypothetical protein
MEEKQVTLTVTMNKAQVEEACQEWLLKRYNVMGTVAPVTAPAPAAPEWDASQVVSWVRTPNPYRPDSERARRFALYTVGASLQLAKSQGIHKRDIDRDLAEGNIQILPTGAVAQLHEIPSFTQQQAAAQ